MTSLARAVIASTLFVSSVALAQDVEMNMNVQVDDQDMPSANISVKTRAPSGDEANMNVQAGGAKIEMKVKAPAVRVEVEEHHEERREVRRREPEVVHVKTVHTETAVRDCGTGEDTGCTMKRNGEYPMDAETFRGIMKSLKAASNELVREDIAEKLFKRNYVTAKQFGQVLDLFENELTKLDVAKTVAPKVVNPQHALGFSSKWENELNGEDYVELMSAQ
ncbi:MAG TPA: DUF4476 domain-containing protein [Myxococcus sp.]|nr:DUF4476 domain-containing protein [Myxococcus sp.]